MAEAEDGKKYVIPANQHYLYVFFPTSVETHLSFYIHAPFSTTPARDNVRHNEINKVLSKQLNQLFADSIKWLLEHGYVTLKFLNNVYPLEDDCREETLQGLYYTGKKLFEEGVRLLQTEDNDYCSVPEAVLPYAKNIPESITQEILQSENENRVCWVKADVCTEAYARLWEYLTHTLGIKVLRWRDVLEIVDYLDDVVKSHPLYGSMRGANDRNFSGKSVATLGNIPSALAIVLESAKWLYDADGTAKIPSELKRSELYSAYTGHGRRLFAQLHFIEENEAVEAAIQSVDTPYQDFVSTMLKKPDELRWMYDAYQKFQKRKMKEEQQPKSLIQVLESQSSEQTAITAESAPDDETLGEFGAVRNVNRRERKLEESFQEGLEGTTIVAPRLHYVYSESNLGEKTFLASQYYGKCQICGKQIFRSNGKPYFEACNILPTNAIPDRYKHSISEGWNSLCLCPNCAAEFKYGKKNLSELISMIQDYHVKENDENLITCRIEMQGEHRAIKYTGKHFLALQKAIGFYSDDAK